MNDQDKRVRDYYARLSMPSEKLEQLISMQGTDHSSGFDKTEADQQSPNRLLIDQSIDDKKIVNENVYPERASRNFSGTNSASVLRQFLKALTVAAWHPALKVVTAGVLVMMVSLWMHNSGTETERMQRTVKEVAMNHTTRLEPEYRGESLASLDNSMQQLPFALVLPKTLVSTYELVGSRYCSLGGALAAHVKFKEKASGKPMSLFVTADSNELQEIRAQQTSHEGIAVEFWKEGGLFFAMAERT